MKKIYSVMLMLSIGLLTCNASEVHISSSTGLLTFASDVNKGTDYSNAIVYLDMDIDMGSCATFSPIGTASHPFKGIFDGQGHRIKNLTYSGSSVGAGFFGCTAGTNTIIRNVIMDNTCTISSTARAVAGIVGFASSTSDNDVLTINNCGNEATVTGSMNVGGIVGAVTTSDNVKVNINNCYNTGAIKGNSVSALIIGYAGSHTTIFNTWSYGSISGYDSGYPYSGKGCTLNSCRVIETYSQTGVSTFSVTNMSSTMLRNSLNKSIESSSTPSEYTTWTTDGQPDIYPRYRNDPKRPLAIVTLNSKGYATYSAVKQFEIVTSGIKAYKASVSGDNITLTELSGDIPAGTGIMLYGGEAMAGKTVDFLQNSSTKADVTDNDLLPTSTSDASPVTMPTSSTVWALGDENQFLRYTGSAFIANRAYLLHEKSSGSKMTIVFAAETATGVCEYESKIQDGVAYNLAGQRVDGNSRGLVIKNGKKYVNR